MPDIQTFYDKIAIHQSEEHKKAVAAYERSIAREKEWKQLVAEGKARCIKTPVIGGYHYHYERI